MMYALQALIGVLCRAPVLPRNVIGPCIHSRNVIGSCIQSRNAIGTYME